MQRPLRGGAGGGNPGQVEQLRALSRRGASAGREALSSSEPRRQDSGARRRAAPAPRGFRTGEVTDRDRRGGQAPASPRAGTGPSCAEAMGQR